MLNKVVLPLIVLAALTASAADPVKVMKAKDEKSQVTVPQHWAMMELNQAAEIQIGNAEDEAYLIVLNEPKQDLHGWNLDKHSRVTLGILLGSVAFPTITGPKSLKIGGHPALQYEIRGAIEGSNVIYIHTTVDGPSMFSQILAWTLPSKADTVKPQLVSAIESFRETP